MDKLHDDMEEQKAKKLRQLTPSGSYVSLFLLMAQTFLHTMINFSIIPCVFEFNYHISERNPLNAALVLAVTPLSTALYSIVLA